MVEPTPLKNIILSTWIIFPRDRDENKKYLSCHHLVIICVYVYFYDLIKYYLTASTTWKMKVSRVFL